MSNILISSPPEYLEVDGKLYKINTDFRHALSIMLAFEDETLAQQEKAEVLLLCIYGDNIPPNIQKAYEKALWFLNCGKATDEDKNAKTPIRTFSFSKDANLIYAAFRQTHNIDLDTAQMHWWKFFALFMDLGSETTFCQLISLRHRHYKGKTTKEEKQAISEMGDLFDVPEIDDRTLEQKIAEAKFMELLEKGNKK